MSFDPLLTAARRVAQARLAGRPLAPPRAPAVRRRYAIGDPQTTADKFWSVLAQHGLLGPGGWLRPQVGLVSMGDHFDFGAETLPVDRDAARARGREGLTLLAWLAAHPAEQVTILLGNHDLARVQELASFDEASFAAAQREAAALRALPPGPARARAEQAFQARYPTLASSEVAVRDLSAFAPEQAALVRALLLEGRAVAACVRRLAGEPILLTHNGVTHGQRRLLGLPAEAGAQAFADALNDYLAERIARVRRQWEVGQPAPLDLAPLYHSAERGRESGGLFAQRPADPATREDADQVFDSERPRRFHPAQLPAGLLQACGHTRPGSSARELRRWATEDAARGALGELRTLRVEGENICYAAGLLPHAPSVATLYMIDPHLHEAATEDVQLLELW